MAPGEGRGCFKVGCLGCLGTGAVVLVIVILLVGLGLLTGGGETRMEPLARAQPIPAVSNPPPDGAARVDHEIDVAEPGRVVLDLNRGSFEIVPGPAGQPIRLEGRYNVGRFELDERYESYGENGWIYRLSFDQRGIGIRSYVETDGEENRITLILPRDAPISLEGRIGIGQSMLELGGLWLTDVDLDIGIGEHIVSFDEPLPIPLGRLWLDTSIGVLRAEHIGRASPRSVRVAHSIGETYVDLRGTWRRDAEIDVTCGIGACELRVPDQARIEVERAGVMLGESSASALRGRDDAPPGAPTLRLSVSGTIGEVRVR